MLSIINIEKIQNHSFDNWDITQIRETLEQYAFFLKNKRNPKEEDVCVILEKKAIGANLYQLWAWDRQFNEIRIKVKAETLKDDTKFKEDLSKLLNEYENRRVG